MRRGFTLLELLLAMTLASFVLFGMMQLYQTVTRYLEHSRDMMTINRTVCLFFNQFERDLSSAYIPFLHKQEKEAKNDQTPGLTPEQQKAATETEQPADKKKEEEQDRARRKTYFVASINEQTQDIVRIDGKKVELCKSLSFISSNPLQVYEQKRVRLVRVVYELIKNKQKSTREHTCYMLVRKETADLANAQAKVDDYASMPRGKEVRSVVIADGISGLYISYVMFQKDIRRYKSDKDKDKDEKAESKKDERKELTLWQWGHIKEVAGIVPQRVNVWVDMWDAKHGKNIRFNALFPVLSYSTENLEKEQKRVEKKEKKKNGKDSAQASGQHISTEQDAEKATSSGLEQPITVLGEQAGVSGGPADTNLLP